MSAAEEGGTQEAELSQEGGDEDPGEPGEPPTELLVQGVDACGELLSEPVDLLIQVDHLLAELLDVLPELGVAAGVLLHLAFQVRDAFFEAGSCHPNPPLPDYHNGWPRGEGGQGTAFLWGALAACAIAYALVAFLLLRHGSSWSPDQAVRWVQVEALHRTGRLDVPYPAHDLDPEGRFFPAGPWFHFRRGGKDYLSYSPYFPTLTVPLYGRFGPAGLVVLPALAALGAVAVTGWVLGTRAPGIEGWGAVALGLASPLVLYATSFWDHSIAVLLAAVASALAVRGLGSGRLRDLVAAGAAVGVGLWFRNEMYVFAGAILLAWLAVAARQRITGALAFGLGAFCAAVPVWVLNARLFGHPLGYKGASLAASRAEAIAGATAGQGADWLTQRLLVAYYQLVNTDFYGLTYGHLRGSLLVTAAFVLGAAFMGIGVRRGSERMVAVGTLVATGAALAVFAARSAVSGLLPAAPFLVLAFLPGPRKRWEGYLWVVCALFAAGVILTGTRGGVQWGPRYLLPILPALVWLAFASLARCEGFRPSLRRALRLSAAILVAVGVLIQASGVDQIEQWTVRNRAGMEGLRRAPAEVVVTSFEWITLLAGPVYFEKKLMLVGSLGELEVLVRSFARLRLPRWTYVPASGARFVPAFVLRWSREAGWPYRVTEDRLDPWSGLRLVTFEGGR